MKSERCVGSLIWHSHVYYYSSPVKIGRNCFVCAPMPIPEASGLGNCLLLMFGNWWKLQVAGARYKIQTYLVKSYKEQSYVWYNPGWMVCCAETQWVSTTAQTVGIAWYGMVWCPLPRQGPHPAGRCHRSILVITLHVSAHVICPKRKISHRGWKSWGSLQYLFFSRTFKVERLDGKSRISF